VNIKTNKNLFVKKLNNIIDVLDRHVYDENISINLMRGSAGIALFYFYYSKYINNQKYYDKGYELIEKIFDSVGTGNNYQTLAGGLAGFGWLFEHLVQNDILEADTNQVIGDLDNFLYPFMLKEIKMGNYDYLHNASGIVLFFLYRKSNPLVKKYIIDYIDLLDEHSEIDRQSLKWKSEIFAKENERVNVYNLSLSHGMASLVAILSKIYSNEINKEKTLKLLKGAINYILSNQFDIKKNLSYFPSYISLDGNKGEPSRMAWCYGDLGIGLSLWNASKVLVDFELEKKAIEILLHSTKRRDLKENNVLDAGLCHGTAGIAHIFNRMYINTGVSEFGEASEYWFNQTLKIARFDDGLAGYKVWRAEKYGGCTNDYGFLEGIAGIGLALISAVSDIEPKWDECLLLS
jgi:lantibiotic modifying enzyme